MSRIAVAAAGLFFLLTVAAARYLSAEFPGARDDSPITADQARAALLKLDELRMIRGNENDPIYLDLKSGPIVAGADSKFEIGRFVTCDLEANTWRMEIANPAIRFFAFATGTFERQRDGVWRAVRTNWGIT